MRAWRAVVSLCAVAVLATVAVGSAGAAGETIRVEDPAVWTTPLLDPDWAVGQGAQVLQVTCAPLYGFTDVPGASGLQLVPDVAAAYPTASPDGLTETVDLRTGFGFSPPSSEQVTAASYVLSWQRYVTLSGPLPDVVSVSAASPTQLVVTLATPDPNFAVDISSLCAVPSSAPPTSYADPTMPSAGPYYISASLPNELVLRQNPNYGGSRIQNLGEIDWYYGVPVATAVADAESGAADYVPNPLGADLAALRTAYGPGSPAAAAGHQQYFENQRQLVTQITLNAGRTAFTNQAARQAVSWAIDRNTLASAATLASPTDQYVFPAMPGYVDWAIYPFGGDEITAMSAAMSAGVSPSTPMDVNVELRPGATFGVSEATWQSELDRALTPLGFVLHYNVVSAQQLFRDIANPATTWDLTVFSWLSGYGDAGSLIGGWFGPAGVSYTNWSDPAWQSRINSALALPYGSTRDSTFAQIDHDLAAGPIPFVPVFDNLGPDLFSARIGCQLYQQYGMDLNDLCVRVADNVAAGGTLSTGSTVDTANPLQTSLTTPVAGPVSIQQGVTSSTVTNYTLFGQQLTISAPTATAASPLQLVFTLDSSVVGSTDPATIDVIRDGTPISSPCDGSGAANPDPCLASRIVLPSGDLQLTVLSSHASTWNFGVADVTAQLAELQATIAAKHLGPGNSLAAKVQTVIDRHAAGDGAGTCAALKALDNELKAQSGKKLSTADAAALRGTVARISGEEGC